MKERITITVSLALGLLAAFILGISSVYANVTQNNPVPRDTFQEYTFFATSTDQTSFATSTSATSTSIDPWFDSNGRKDNGYFVVQGAEAVTFLFSRGDTTGEGNTGSSKFEVEVSEDGETWHDFERLYLTDISKTATSTVWITAATSTVIANMDIADGAFYAVRCVIEEVTDGEHSCKATARW